jgi:hypothetical protein
MTISAHRSTHNVFKTFRNTVPSVRSDVIAPDDVPIAPCATLISRERDHRRRANSKTRRDAGSLHRPVARPPPVVATTTSTTASVDASHRTERDGAALASVRARDSAPVDAARDSSIAEQ